MKSFGHDPVIGIIHNLYNPHLELARKAENMGIKVQVFPCRKKSDLRTIRLIRSFIKTNKPNIVHTHGYKSNLYGLLASIGLAAKVTTNHLWKRTDIKTKLYSMFDSICIRFFDRIVAVSDDIKDDMVSKGIASEKITVIYNGVDIDRLVKASNTQKLRNDFEISSNSIVVGCVGSLTLEKGHSYLLEAAKKISESYQNVKFLIVGEGVLRRDLEEEARRLGILPSVIFAGTRNDMPQIYALIDVFVLPSLVEGMPMVVLEAMAAGKPVVASNVGSVSKAVKENDTGLLVNPRDVDRLTSALIFMLKNQGEASRLGLNARARIQSRFSSRIMFDRYLDIYDSLLTHSS
jgi:glycosyltransferase involved in cell wall biosynthesis